MIYSQKRAIFVFVKIGFIRRGVFTEWWAEIIPIEPDADNAAVGRTF
jgi:hypothetical protein